MKITLITDVRVFRIKDAYYTTGPFFKILERYSKGFGRVTLVTRVIEKKEMTSDYFDISNFCNDVVSAPPLTKSLVINYNDELGIVLKNSDLIILRLPSLVSLLLFRYVKHFHSKYMVEVMGCIWDAFWNHSLPGKIIAPYSFLKMKKIVKHADYAVYVTNRFLQNRYPCKGETIGLSNVNIERVGQPKKYKNKNKYSLLTAAAVDVRYKGQQYVIKAIRCLKDRGLFYDYYLAGGGEQEYLKRIAERNHVEKQVHFLGSLTHDDLLEYMRKIDFYIQPSLQEGLPRSVIEAMSCGCVCFGSNTAGIPELLEDSQIFKRRSVKSIVKILSKPLTSSALDRISFRNIESSKQYQSVLLDKKRYDFYNKIKKDIKRSDG